MSSSTTDAAALARHYARFRVTERCLLTGHSHQAWPDVGFEAQQRAWLDAAEHLDRKWSLADAQADRVRDGWRRLLGEPGAEIALGQNTHELVVRLISALPLARRPVLVTTDGEFHTLRRQLDRLAEAGLEVRRAPASPADAIAERLSALVDERTAAVFVSSVLFETAAIVPGLDGLARACARVGAELVVDAYHHLNVVPFDIQAQGLSGAFIVGGGYKYCQLGEGNCFLRVPPDCRMRPAITGWFAEFGHLERISHEHDVAYGSGAARFAGSTYDPVSHYRGAAVFDFFDARQLTAGVLRHINQAQTRLIADAVEQADLDPRRIALEPLPPDQRAGFVALRAPDASALARQMADHGIWCDARGDRLRLGPAPYVTNEQLFGAVETLAAIVRSRPGIQ